MTTLFRVAFVYQYYWAPGCLLRLESRFMCEELGMLEKKEEKKDPKSFFNPSRRHVLVLKIIGGISVLGACGFNIAMNFPNNEILIGVSIVVVSPGIAILPLSNELIVETTYPAGEATSTAIGVWLAGPVSGAFIASSSLIPYGAQDDYPYSTCREGELQDLSWFVTMMNGIFLVYYIFFVYFYRKADHFLLPKLFRTILIWIFNRQNDRFQSCPYLRQEALKKTMNQIGANNERIATISSLTNPDSKLDI